MGWDRVGIETPVMSPDLLLPLYIVSSGIPPVMLSGPLSPTTEVPSSLLVPPGRFRRGRSKSTTSRRQVPLRLQETESLTSYPPPVTVSSTLHPNPSSMPQVEPCTTQPSRTFSKTRLGMMGKGFLNKLM